MKWARNLAMLIYNLLPIWRWVSVLRFQVSRWAFREYNMTLNCFEFCRWRREIEKLYRIYQTYHFYHIALNKCLRHPFKKPHFPMGCIFTYSRVGWKGGDVGVKCWNRKSNDDGKWKTNKKQNLLCKKAVYFKYWWSLFKDGCYFNKKCYVTRSPSFSHSEPA